MSKTLFILFLASLSSHALAQGLDSDQTATANALVGSFYAVFSDGDAERIQDLFLPGAGLFLKEPAGDGGAPAQPMRPEDVMSSTGFFQEDLSQRRLAAQFHGYDDIAQIFSTFEWINQDTGEAMGRGIDSFQLSFDGTRWWVMSVVRQPESPALPIPERYLPSPVLSRETPPTVVLPAELDRILRDYELHWRRGQADQLAALFTPSGWALPAGRPPRQGREAIANGYGTPGGDLRLRPVDFATHGDIGYIIGTYGYGDEGGDIGKWILAVRQESDGVWRIAADMDNASR